MTPQEFIQREWEIQEATKQYPDLEMSEAYHKWKDERGETVKYLMINEEIVAGAKEAIRQILTRPCTQVGCDGLQLLEAVCDGCVEGRAGYHSKWTCQKCLHRELSKKEYTEWLMELSSIKNTTTEK